MASRVPNDPTLSPETRRLLDELSRRDDISGTDFTAIKAAPFVTVAADTTLTGERVLTAGAGISIADGGANSTVTVSAAAGAVIQTVQDVEDTALTPTATIPRDDTAPTSSEGTEILSQAITPADNSNKVLVEAEVFAALSTNTVLVIAVFRGTTCIRAASHRFSSADFETVVRISVLDSPASASAQTYSVRVGPSTAATVYVNGLSGGRLYGGAAACTLTLKEIAAS